MKYILCIAALTALLFAGCSKLKIKLNLHPIQLQLPRLFPKHKKLTDGNFSLTDNP